MFSLEIFGADEGALHRARVAGVCCTGLNRTMYSIGVKWDEVPQNHRNGDITSNTVGYHSDTSSESQQEMVLNAPTRFANLTKLSKNTKYTITVLASNNKGPGPASDPIVAETIDGGKHSSCFVILKILEAAWPSGLGRWCCNPEVPVFNASTLSLAGYL